jgi:hypothetical protein
MKTTTMLAALLIACSAWAQAPAPAQEPAKADVAKPEALKPQAVRKAKPQSRTAVAKKWRRHEDARHCLERSTNTEIIKCAEEYL